MHTTLGYFIIYTKLFSQIPQWFSRLPSNEKDSFASVKIEAFMTELIHAPFTSKEIGEFSKRDPIILGAIDFVLSRWSSKGNEQFKPYFCRTNELAWEFCLIWENKGVIPFQFRETILIELHENHPGIVRMKALAHSYAWWPNIESEIEITVKFRKSFQINQTLPAKAPTYPWEKQLLPGWEFMLILLIPSWEKCFELFTISILNGLTQFQWLT